MEKIQYSKSMGVKGIIRSIRRNIVSIVLFIIVFFTSGFIALNAITPKKYQSTGQLSNGMTIASTILNTLSDGFKSDSFTEITLEKLNGENIIHKNGGFITKNELLDGITIPNVNNSLYINISFANSDNTIVKKTLNVMLESIIEYFKQENRNEFTKLQIAKSASDPQDISSFKSKLIILLFTSILISSFVPTIIDYKNDLVYEIDDIKELGINVLELNYDGKEKNKHE